MAEELVRLTNQNDEMEEKVKDIPKLKIQLKVRAIIRKYRTLECSLDNFCLNFTVFAEVLIICMAVCFRIWSRGTTPSYRCMEKKLKRQRS